MNVLLSFPELIREDAQRILFFTSYGNDQVGSDAMNAALTALWLANADMLGVPVGARILPTPEYVKLHKRWGWDGQWIKKLSDAPYMVVSEYRGGGPCITFPDGTWDGGIEFSLVLACRNEWLDRNGDL